jgi:glutathione S-transferase
VQRLTAQRWVPVLVHGEEVVHDSHRILGYLEHVGARSSESPRGDAAEA